MFLKTPKKEKSTRSGISKYNNNNLFEYRAERDADNMVESYLENDFKTNYQYIVTLLLSATELPEQRRYLDALLEEFIENYPDQEQLTPLQIKEIKQKLIKLTIDKIIEIYNIFFSTPTIGSMGHTDTITLWSGRKSHNLESILTPIKGIANEYFLKTFISTSLSRDSAMRFASNIDGDVEVIPIIKITIPTDKLMLFPWVALYSETITFPMTRNNQVKENEILMSPFTRLKYIKSTKIDNIPFLVPNMNQPPTKKKISATIYEFKFEFPQYISPLELKHNLFTIYDIPIKGHNLSPFSQKKKYRRRTQSSSFKKARAGKASVAGKKASVAGKKARAGKASVAGKKASVAGKKARAGKASVAGKKTKKVTHFPSNISGLMKKAK